MSYRAQNEGAAVAGAFARSSWPGWEASLCLQPAHRRGAQLPTPRPGLSTAPRGLQQADVSRQVRLSQDSFLVSSVWVCLEPQTYRRKEQLSGEVWGGMGNGPRIASPCLLGLILSALTAALPVSCGEGRSECEKEKHVVAGEAWNG